MRCLGARKDRGSSTLPLHTGPEDGAEAFPWEDEDYHKCVSCACVVPLAGAFHAPAAVCAAACCCFLKWRRSCLLLLLALLLPPHQG
jgi:hypothetical protein